MQSSTSTRFVKYHGAGNDFLLIDDRDLSFDGDVVALCDRRCGVGADGVILFQPGPRMRIFNADGGEATMCGNGLRCFGRFLSDLGLGDTFAVETEAGILNVEVGEMVTAELPSPTGTFPLIDTGVPHYLTCVEQIDEAPVETLGRQLRLKHNANATFFSVQGSRLFCRTYERGVEGETLACGTGAAAAALASGLPGEIEVVMRSGESLWIDSRRMRGPAIRVFDGSLSAMLLC